MGKVTDMPGAAPSAPSNPDVRDDHTWAGKHYEPIEDETLEILFPSKTVDFEGQDGRVVLSIKVRGVETQDLQKFQSALAGVFVKAWPVWEGLKARRLEGGSFLASVVQIATPFVMTDLFGLMQSCCSHDLSRLPHHALARVVDAWLMESFGSPGKWKPWQAVFENLARAFEAGDGSQFLRIWSSPADSPEQPTETSPGGPSEGSGSSTS